MPLYEYQCQKCGEIFEVKQKFADKPLTTHVKGCGGAVKRLLTAPALQFKGSGWYITDYAKGSNSVPAAKSQAETAAESKSASTPAPAAASTGSSSSSADKK